MSEHPYSVDGGAAPADPAAGPDQPPVTLTGHSGVDASLRAVAAVAGAPPAEQLPVLHTAHETLRETLASLDEG